MSATTTTTVTMFRGYFRQTKREPWRELVSAETYERCWDELLSALAESGRRNGESLVSQNDPNIPAHSMRCRF